MSNVNIVLLLVQWCGVGEEAGALRCYVAYEGGRNGSRWLFVKGKSYRGSITVEAAIVVPKGVQVYSDANGYLNLKGGMNSGKATYNNNEAILASSTELNIIDNAQHNSKLYLKQ